MSYPYDLVVFDLAGTTVVDEGDVVAETLCRALRDRAAVAVPVAMATSLMGIPKPAAIRRLLAQAGVEPVPDLVHAVHEHFRSLMLIHYREGQAVREVPGTTAVFRVLKEAGVRVAVDTGFSRDITDAILERCGWASSGLVDVSVASDEVPAGRPAPFMIFQAMQRLGVSDVRRVVKVGDTPSDLAEGMNAGCGRVVGVTRGSHTRQQLQRHPHTDLIGDVSELPELLRRSPRPDVQLHTPGPANTSETVRRAMTRDIGAWDRELIELAEDVRRRMLSLAGVDQAAWDCVLLQGSGTYGVEAALRAATPHRDGPQGGGVLIATNGAYGDRMVRIAEVLGRPFAVVRGHELEPLSPGDVAEALQQRPGLTTLAVVHCETTTGLLNDVVAIGRAARAVRPGLTYLVDAMSSFGAYETDWEAAGVDWLVTSSNKCLQGVPGLACVLARTQALEASVGRSGSLALDLHDQWTGLRTYGRFRFTPPTHVLLALRQALKELEAEGGVRSRFARYERMRRRLVEGMTRRGYRILIQPEHRSCIISTFAYPTDPRFSYAELYARLARRGVVIYPGKLSRAETFRVGHIGDLDEQDIDRLLEAFDAVREEMGFATGPADALSSSQAPVGAP
ncbi:MAG: 2-aminoethylphosphonate--pyruvate transaminase [Tepidisphaerales bacterium]